MSKGDISLDTPNPCGLAGKALCCESKLEAWTTDALVFGCRLSISPFLFEDYVCLLWPPADVPA